jgi:O-antigen/teichoic acid export membrane protein
MSILNKLFSNSMIYIISLLFNKGLSFVLLPVLTFYLSKEDYGVLGFVTAMSTIASIYIGFFPSVFLLSKYAQYGKERISEYIHHILLLTISTFFLVLLILFGLKDFILPEAIVKKNLIIVVITCYALFTVFFNFLDTLFQVEKNAIKFAILQTVQSVGALGLALILIIEFSYGWKGKYYAELAVLFFIFLFTIYYIIKNKYYKFNTNFKKLKEVTFFLFPITFTVLGLYIMGTIDRIFVADMIGLEAAGIYNVAIIMAVIINMVYDSIIKAFNPILYESYSDRSGQSKRKIVKIIYAYSLICVVVLAGYIFFLPYVFHLMINDKFSDALVLIPILALGFTFEGLRKGLESQLVFNNKVKSLAVVTLIASLTNIVLNYFLIKIYGIQGAAYATAIAFFVLYILTFILFSKNNNLPWLLKNKKESI